MLVYKIYKKHKSYLKNNDGLYSYVFLKKNNQFIKYHILKSKDFVNYRVVYKLLCDF